MKKLTIFALGALCSVPTLAFANSTDALEQEILGGEAAAQTASLDLNQDLSNATSGFGRFRFGGYLGGGFYRSAVPEGLPKVSGLGAEAGVYTLFNPIRDWADIELGVRGFYVFPMDYEVTRNDSNGRQKTATHSYSGFSALGVYGGPVFRFPNAQSAMAVGVYKNFLTKASFSTKQKENVMFTQENLKYKPGQGVYLEYQWTGADKAIPYVRLSYGTQKSELKINDQQVQTHNEKLYGLSLGVKF